MEEEGVLLELAKLFEKKVNRKVYSIGKIIGIIVGSIACIVGIIITILGFSGTIEWVFEVGGFTSRLVNAGPGVFFVVAGVIILWRYAPKSREEFKLKISDTEDKLISFIRELDYLEVKRIVEGLSRNDRNKEKY